MATQDEVSGAYGCGSDSWSDSRLIALGGYWVARDAARRGPRGSRELCACAGHRMLMLMLTCKAATNARCQPPCWVLGVVKRVLQQRRARTRAGRRVSRECMAACESIAGRRAPENACESSEPMNIGAAKIHGQRRCHSLMA